VNRKAARAALRSALASHANAGSLAVVDGAGFERPSTRQAKGLVDDWGRETPLLVVAAEDEEALVKSFRNLPNTFVTVPSELDVASVVWARALLISQAALPQVEGRAT
jgi:large subunit ribosomal protein L4